MCASRVTTVQVDITGMFINANVCAQPATTTVMEYGMLIYANVLQYVLDRFARLLLSSINEDITRFALSYSLFNIV